MALNETKESEAVLETGSTTGSYTVQPDDDLRYEEPTESPHCSSPKAGRFSHQTDLLQLGSSLGGKTRSVETTADQEARITREFAALAVQLDHAVRNRRKQDSQTHAFLKSLQELHPRVLPTTDYYMFHRDLSYTAVAQREDAYGTPSRTNTNAMGTNPTALDDPAK